MSIKVNVLSRRNIAMGDGMRRMFQVENDMVNFLNLMNIFIGDETEFNSDSEDDCDSRFSFHGKEVLIDETTARSRRAQPPLPLQWGRAATDMFQVENDMVKIKRRKK